MEYEIARIAHLAVAILGTAWLLWDLYRSSGKSIRHRLKISFIPIVFAVVGFGGYFILPHIAVPPP